MAKKRHHKRKKHKRHQLKQQLNRKAPPSKRYKKEVTYAKKELSHLGKSLSLSIPKGGDDNEKY